VSFSITNITIQPCSEIFIAKKRTCFPATACKDITKKIKVVGRFLVTKKKAYSQARDMSHLPEMSKTSWSHIKVTTCDSVTL